jgi:hypothetical protein
VLGAFLIIGLVLMSLLSFVVFHSRSLAVCFSAVATLSAFFLIAIVKRQGQN